MLFFGIQDFWFRLGVFLILTILSGLFIIWMWHDYFVVDPYNPNLVGTQTYGHNGSGDFERLVKITLIEYFVLLIIFLPYSFSQRYWVRALILQILFGGWILMLGMAGMHTGGVYMIHLIWLLAANIIIFVLFIAAIVAEFASRNKSQKATK